MLWDTHMHTHHSGDSDALMPDMIQAAVRQNLDGICFTDHFDYDYPDDPNLFLLDFDSYIKEVRSFQDTCHDRLSIRLGIEVGLQPHITEINRKAVTGHPFDFVIGSSHVVHGIDPYYPKYYEGRSEKTAYREYFESILENLNTYSDFDVYGHLDYVVRYGPDRNRFYTYEAYADIIDEILRKLISMGKGIEVNTAGFKYGLGHPNPTEAVLLRYHELGGEILTLGADAHAPEHVAYAFDRLPQILRHAGFRYFTVFTGRKPNFLPLPE